MQRRAGVVARRGGIEAQLQHQRHRRRIAIPRRVGDGAMIRRTQGIRRMGSAGLDLAYVAAGRLDLYWELRIKPWDVAAGSLIVTEAGCVDGS